MSNDDETTNPGGKTQEELDAEETSDLQDEICELREELDNFRASNHAMAKREERIGNELRALQLRRPRWPWLASSIMLLLLVTTLAVTSSVYQSVDAHLAELAPPAVECPVTECPVAEVEPTTIVPTAISPVEGYIVEGEYGMPRLMPWPDASAYHAETFVEDCRAVCAVPAPFDHPSPGRVLVTDPEHLVCVCFHAESSFPVTRWINWERVR